MFTAADVKLMETRLNPEIMAASALMDKARQWLGPDLQSLPALTQKLMGDMDVRLVLHIHGFTKKSKNPETVSVDRSDRPTIRERGAGCWWRFIGVPMEASRGCTSCIGSSPGCISPTVGPAEHNP